MQNIELSPSEILDLVGEMAELHEEGEHPDWFAAAAITVRNFHSSSDKAFCIMERMGCLVAIMKDSRMRGWTIKKADEEFVFTRYSVFAATAKCALQINEKRIFFNPEEFFSIALTETDSEGRA
jgi:hypothetical protein